MISQRCPRCHSSRIRSGYRPTPIWSKIMFRYNLLCDGCNWEFKGFAVPGTVSSKPSKKRKKPPPSFEKPVFKDDKIDNIVSNLGNKDNII